METLFEHIIKLNENETISVCREGRIFNINHTPDSFVVTTYNKEMRMLADFNKVSLDGDFVKFQNSFAVFRLANTPTVEEVSA